MAVQLTDDGFQIKFVRGTKIKLIPKEGLTISQFDTGVFLNVEDQAKIKIYLEEVSVPVVASVQALSDAIDAMIENVSGGGLPAGASTEAKQDDNITKLEEMRVLLDSIATEDFATQTTLALIDISLNSIKAEDFATQTTLALIDVSLNSIKAEDFATETTLEAVRVLLASISSNTAAVPTSLTPGGKTITTAGTREALAGSTAIKFVIIVADVTNTGAVVFGDNTVVADLVTRVGLPLFAGDPVSIEIDNLNKIFLDAEVDGEGVKFIYQ